jgi:carbon monoxide dehydrogenase subunit G
MTLSGTFVFAGPRNVVWDLLQDPTVLAKALPGTKTLTQVSDGRYEGVMKVSVGPLTAAEFAVTVTLSDRVAPSSFKMAIDGKGGVGFSRGTASVALTDDPGGGTLMTYTSDVQVGGRIAGVGQRLIELVGRGMMKQALDGLNKELQARLQNRS